MYSEQEKWVKFYEGISIFDAKLLEWSCTCEEIRNHENVGLHTDGNRNHCLESSMYFSKVGMSNDSFLILPTYGFQVKAKQNATVIHSNLRNTLHCGDFGRGVRDFASISFY